MNLFDTDTISRLRLLRHHLSWVSALPLLNVPGKPTSFASSLISLRLNGMGQAVVEAPTVAAQVRQELIRRGWVHAYDGLHTFTVAIHRYLREPLAQPAVASGHPLGQQPGPEGISDNGPATWPVGRSVFTEFPVKPRSKDDL